MNCPAASALCAALALIVAAGCRTTPGESYGRVEEIVSDRTGVQPRWTTTASAVPEVEQRVRTLVQSNLTADTAVQIALINNPRIQAKLEQIGIAQADLVQAGLLRNPTFAASWRFPESGGGMNSEYSLAGSFLDIFILPLRKRIASRALAAAELQLANEILNLASEVKAAFYTVQSGEQLADRLATLVEVNEASADVAKRRHDAGNISDLEFAEQTAVYAESRVILAQTQKQLRSDREALTRLLGLWGVGTDWKVAAELPPLPETEPSLENLESLAIEQRLDLAAARARWTNVASALSLTTRTRFVPASIDIGVSTERETDGQRITGPTLELGLPIFDQGQAEIAKLTAQFRQAQRQLEERAINIRSEVRDARDRLITDRDIAEYYSQIVLPLRRQIVTQSLLQYNAMQIGPVGLLRARERELEAEKSHIEALRDYWISRAELERALGGRIPPPGSAPLPQSPGNSPQPHEGHNH